MKKTQKRFIGLYRMKSISGSIGKARLAKLKADGSKGMEVWGLVGRKMDVI